MGNYLFEKEMLLGQLDTGDLVFANVKIGKDSEFSTSFDMCRPASMEEAEEEARQFVEDLDTDTKMMYLCKYDNRPSELADTLIDVIGVKDILDCSLFGAEIDDYVFVSMSCGQCDYRLEGELESPVNQEAVDYIMDMWDNNHLSVIPEEKAKEVIAMCDKLPDKYSCETEDFISNLLSGGRDMEESR